MNIVPWVLQILLAIAFFAHGWLPLSPPLELVDLLNSLIPPALRIFLGVAEVLAGALAAVPFVSLCLCVSVSVSVCLCGSYVIVLSDHSTEVISTNERVQHVFARVCN